MRILFTGGAGRLGRHVVDHLVARGDEVVSIVRSASATAASATAASAADGLARPTIEVAGDISDTRLMREQMSQGIDAVVHLAALPKPGTNTVVELLQANTLTTMNVLEAAGECGVRTVVAASSISILGMAWSAQMMHPLYLPVDEDHPLRPTEGYSLSKENDEAGMRMAARRWGMTVIGLRFPFTASQEDILARAASLQEDPSLGLRVAQELWAYLDVRDAARAVEASLDAATAGTISGALVLNVTADDVLVDEPLQDLLAQWHPDVPVRGELGQGAYNSARARETIGFTAAHLLPRGARVGARS